MKLYFDYKMNVQVILMENKPKPLNMSIEISTSTERNTDRIGRLIMSYSVWRPRLSPALPSAGYLTQSVK